MVQIVLFQDFFVFFCNFYNFFDQKRDFLKFFSIFDSSFHLLVIIFIRFCIASDDAKLRFASMYLFNLLVLLNKHCRLLICFRLVIFSVQGVTEFFLSKQMRVSNAFCLTIFFWIYFEMRI